MKVEWLQAISRRVLPEGRRIRISSTQVLAVHSCLAVLRRWGARTAGDAAGHRAREYPETARSAQCVWHSTRMCAEGFRHAQVQRAGRQQTHIGRATAGKRVDDAPWRGAGVKRPRGSCAAASSGARAGVKRTRHVQLPRRCHAGLNCRRSLLGTAAVTVYTSQNPLAWHARVCHCSACENVHARAHRPVQLAL